MSERTLQQYFGPSPRHDRACVELGFPLDGETHNLAPLDAALLKLGFKLRDVLPDEALPLDEAVCRLASALMAKHHDWWAEYGRDGERGWVALSFPFPTVAALALDCALDALGDGEVLAAGTEAKLRRLSDWLGRISQIQLRMLGAADVFGRDTAILSPTAEIYQVGQCVEGMHFQRMSNERDSLTGMKLERSKHITAETLARFGLPATRGVLLGDAKLAGKAIDRVGLPCVVKPTTMSKGAGVATGLDDPAQVAAAVAHALKLSGGEMVRVENHIEGYDHRLMVIGYELVWVYRKVAASVSGDGTATVRALIESENRRRAAVRRGTDAYLYQIAINQELEGFIRGRYGRGVDSVLAQDERIELAGQANIARGGYLEDVTGSVHPDVRDLAIRVARLFRLEAMGIDYITPDISRSWKDVDTAIVEVNRTPGVSGMGDTTLALRTFFPNRLSGRVPSVAVIGDEAYRRTIGEALSRGFADGGLRPVLADYLAADAPAGTVQRGLVPPPIEVALLDPQGDAFVALCDPELVESAGLPLRHCDLLVAQDQARFRWLQADAVLGGAASRARIDLALGKLKRVYQDPAQGGPLPVLEPLGEPGADGAFRLKVWRARAIPRAWFWREVGLATPESDDSMTTHADLLAAVRALAQEELGGGAKLPAAFAHDELTGSWFRIAFEAAITLPAKQAERAAAALRNAAERVNAIVALKVP